LQYTREMGMRAAFLRPSLAWLVLLANVPANRCYASDTAPKADELLARHLDSIGPASARSGVKTRVVQGAATYRLVVGGGGRQDGKTGMVSEDRKLRFLMKFPQGDYTGENIVYNGSSIGMAFSNSSQRHSPFSYFLEAQDVIIKDGLLGGVLSTAWPLLDLTGRKAKLTVDGVRKVDGQQVYQVSYEPSKHPDVRIALYFDAETFRHVKTVYSTSLGNNVGEDITKSSKLQAERTTLEERFSDFQAVDGLTLPTHWNIQFTRELPDGTTSVTEWDLKEDQIRNNVGLDPRNFDVK
jgi:hypothetical protein